MRKSFLRKGTAAVAAMLLGANVMAQSFDFTKEFQGDMEDMFDEGVVAPSLTKDGNLRLVLVEESEDNGETRDSEGNYCYTYKINKLSILNNKLDTEKEFTSGPLFDEYVDVTVKSAAKTLKVESVDTVYLGDEALNRFYDYFYVYIYNEETDEYNHYSYSYLVENFTEDEVRTYVNRWLEEESSYEDITFLEERFLFESYYVQESVYYDWGKQYPTEGWIYKDYDEVYYVRINYTSDEYEEVSRYNSSIRSAYCDANMWYTDFISEGSPATISQGLFNDDNNYEFLLPEMALLEHTSYSSYEGVLTTYYEHEPIGFKVVSEDGTVLQRLMVNEEKDNDMRCYAYIISLGNKNYLMVNSYKRTISESGYDYTYTDEVTRFYEIKKSGTGASIQKVREMRGGMNIRPTVADRDEQITITLDDDNNSVARELIITGVNGQLVERRAIPAGENTIQMNAAMMRSGMYNFTLQKKGEVVDNGKVIVK